MLSLNKIQEKFQRHLLTGDTDILAHIVTDDNVSKTRRLEIYKNAYITRLTDALTIDFPNVHAILGEQQFSGLCLDYINQHPSIYSSLRWFGSDFSAFIRQHPDYREKTYLYELAVMDWMFISAFDAAEENTLDPSYMTNIAIESWPGIRIRFHPSVDYFSYQWNIIEIWHANKEAITLPSPSLIRKPGDCLIWRQGLSTRFRVLDDDEALIFHDAVNGVTFGQICEHLSLLPDYDDSESDAIAIRCAVLLKHWLDDGLVTEINY